MSAVVRQFRGISPQVEPRLLANNQAVSAVNCRLDSGVLVPLKANEAITALPKAGPILSIYRFGQDTDSDSQFWFHSASDVDYVRGPVKDDVQERTYFTGDGAPKVTDNSIALTGGTEYPMNSYLLGVPAPTTSPSVAVSGVADPGSVPEDRVYAVTYVTAWGEESAPSDATLAVAVSPGQTVNLTAIPTGPVGNYNVTTKRIYRSVPGTLGTPYLLVAEIAAATATYNDTKTAIELGEQLVSETFLPPPADLRGLVRLPNGGLAGITDRAVHFSEPGFPHAWPAEYIRPTASKTVGLAVFDTTVAVLTVAEPLILTGSHPSSYGEAEPGIPQACVSKRSIAKAPNGSVYASPDGLFHIGGGGMRNVLEGKFTADQWRALQPETLHGHIYDGQYVGFHATGGIVVDLRSGEVTTLDWTASAGYYDPQRDKLFLVTGGTNLVAFDRGATLLQGTWKSPDYYSPRKVNLGYARVEADLYPVTFKCRADGVLTHTEVVADAGIFSLPDEPVASTWSFEVVFDGQVNSAGFALTIEQLTRA